MPEGIQSGRKGNAGPQPGGTADADKSLQESDNPACFGIIIALFTGVRIGELLALRWKSVDFTNHTFFVKVSLSRLKTFDKDSPTATTLEKRIPKTKNSRRNINIIDELYADLVSIRDSRMR